MLQNTTAGSPMNVNESQFDRGGKFQIKKQGPYSVVEVSVSENDSVLAQGGAMISMHADVDLKATLFGGVGAACLRCCCAGESFLFTEFILPSGSAKRSADVLL